MTAALALREPAHADTIDTMIEHSILRFLNGATEGRELFEALYGAPLDEPVPERMLALVRAAKLD